MDVVIIETGTANMASVAAGFRRAGATVRLSRDPADALQAPALVVPGVGTFAAGMAALRDAQLVEPLRTRLGAGRATFGICLGLQLLGRSSAESQGVAGLGVIDADVQPLAGELVVPHMGWNEVRGNGGLVEPGWAYFANSYAFGDVPAPWQVATTEYGEAFVAAVQRDAVVACQFHPELSGAWGLELMRRWLKEASC